MSCATHFICPGYDETWRAGYFGKVSIADILPTVADLIGFKFPADYKIDGKSLVPYLFGKTTDHRNWIYSYRGPEQLVRGHYVLKDGGDKWWDLTNKPQDLTSYEPITNWANQSGAMKGEKDSLIKVLPGYDLYYDEYNAPGITKIPNGRPKYSRKNKAQKVY